MEEVLSVAKKLEQVVEKTKQEMTEREEQLKEKEVRFENEKKEMQKRYEISENVIDMNVGGKHYTTYKATLCAFEGSMIEAMFSGRHPTTKDPKGRYFIDRDGELFGLVLNFLRNGVLLWPKDENGKTQLKLELEYYGLLEYVIPPTMFPDSKILQPEHEEKLHGFIGSEKHWKLLYQGSRDGFGVKDFHSKCDGQGATVTIILSSTGCIFGGYTSQSWNSSGSWFNDSNAFLFSLKNPNGSPFKCTIKQLSHAIFGHVSYGPTFGSNHDLYIADNCNLNTSSYVNTGGSYSTNSHQYELNGGSYNVQVQEIEVFAVDQNPQISNIKKRKK